MKLQSSLREVFDSKACTMLTREPFNGITRVVCSGLHEIGKEGRRGTHSERKKCCFFFRQEKDPPPAPCHLHQDRSVCILAIVLVACIQFTHPRVAFLVVLFTRSALAFGHAALPLLHQSKLSRLIHRLPFSSVKAS